MIIMMILMVVLLVPLKMQYVILNNGNVRT